jgi:hypothetical protein
MHWRHWQSELQHFHNAGPDFWILANATGQRLSEVDSFHHSRQRPVPLDHFTYGTFRLPSQLPATRGGGIKRHSQQRLGEDQQLERHHHLRKCGQHTQRVCPGLALCGNAQLGRRSTHMDKSQTKVSTTICNPIGQKTDRQASNLAMKLSKSPGNCV